MIGGKLQNSPHGYTTAMAPQQCIAKTVKLSAEEIKPGISVENHCRIVGLVAQELLRLFPERIRSELFPCGIDLVAACHDIGKISPDFQEMLYETIPGYAKNLLQGLENANAERAGRKGPSFHAAVSQVSLSDVDCFIPQIVGVHHGFTPDSRGLQKGCEVHGGPEWQKQRDVVTNRLQDYFGCILPDDAWPDVSEIQAAVAAGLVTVADWIGSGDSFSQMVLNSVWDEKTMKALVRDAVSSAGFRPLLVRKKLSFTDVFSFSPKDVQTVLMESVLQPGVYLLEAPMGIGKTEAALYAAYRMIEAQEATGIYFALPTQLTSEKIYERMDAFVNKIIDPSLGIEKTHLVHSAAWLHDIVLGEDGDSGGSWFDGTKRGILAPFAIGTIDQALMAVMNVRHGFVRTFGLAGKVVILDEVHSYDTYTGTILNALIALLRQLHCTVIILSATLTEGQKKSLLQIDTSLASGYPLISGCPGVTTGSTIFFERHSAYDDKLQVAVSFITETDRTIYDQAIERAATGQQVLWIENTVDEAQDAFRILSVAAQQAGVECGLLHSRFTRQDRTILEEHWVSLFGKEGSNKRTQCGRILVGTQVLEQSLDIDADFLVTRLCPTDMLLQRIGRLWRHRENDSLRPHGSCCEVYIISPVYDAVAQGSNTFGKTGKVYSTYVLFRTLEVWKDRTTIQVPQDIRLLLEATYSERKESGPAERYKEELYKEKEKLQRMAAIGLSRGIQTLPESKATTRYSEIDSINVLLLSDIQTAGAGKTVRFLDGSSLDVPAFSAHPQQKRKIAATLLQQCVRVSAYIAPEPIEDLFWLKPYVYIGSKDDEEAPFRLAIVQNDEELRGIFGEDVHKTYSLQYNALLGYQSHKK